MIEILQVGVVRVLVAICHTDNTFFDATKMAHIISSTTIRFGYHVIIVEVELAMKFL